MLIDDVKISVAAGHGGKGAVAFNKNLMSLGPAGGSGGRGGSVYAEGVSDLSALGQFRFKKQFAAENGRDGRDQFRDGHDGKDLIMKLPIGTVAHNLTTGEDISIERTSERILLAQGGIGGKGNFQFKSAINTSPTQFQSGRPGDEFEFRFELKLIADVGFIGFPNAGKSSMLNELTNANVKVANYPFTTLESNLGVYYDLILADIPGLIEGSSTGKGLGIKFLRHIDRTRILFHFISFESASPVADYRAIRKELGAHNKLLLKKPEYVFLTKSDLAEAKLGAAPETLKDLKKKLAALKKINPHTIAVSIVDDDSMMKIKKILNGIQKKK
jgi:GTP-binding protein